MAATTPSSPATLRWRFAHVVGCLLALFSARALAEGSHARARRTTAARHLERDKAGEARAEEAEEAAAAEEGLGAARRAAAAAVVRREGGEGGSSSSISLLDFTETLGVTASSSSDDAASEGRRRVVRGWMIAIGASIVSSVFVVLGVTIQSFAQQSPGDYKRVGDMVLSPLWFSGTGLIVMAVVVGDYLAYSLAPLSLVQPLSGITVVLNLVVAPLALGEKMQVWPDVPASILIFVGCVLTAVSGAHQEKGRDLHDLIQLILRPQSLSYQVPLTIFLVFLTFYGSRPKRLGLGAAAAASGSSSKRNSAFGPGYLDMFLLALTAAGTASLTNVFVKGLALMVKHFESVPFFVVTCLITCMYAVMQMNFINRGLRSYLQTVFFPVYNALLLLVNTVYAAIFYEEVQEIGRDSIGWFAAGVVLTLCGVLMFVLRPPTEGQQLTFDNGS